MAAEEGKETFGRLLFVVCLCTFGYLLLRVGKILCCQLPLYAYKTLYQRLILLELLVVAFRYGTRDDERCAGIIDED